MAEILALGDCNTLGIGNLRFNSYSERFAKKINKSVKNCGFTMSTTREMIHFFNDFKSDNTEIILIQYGLVDSWKTFKYAPYVLYYPDNFIRKFFRKVIKKYKKICKAIGLNSLLGVESVVPINEFKNNLEFIINNSQNCLIFLIDTIPNKDIFRNSEIKKYNLAMQEISDKHESVFKVNIYNFFENKKDFYLDGTHLSQNGIELISNKLFEEYNTAMGKNT